MIRVRSTDFENMAAIRERSHQAFALLQLRANDRALDIGPLPDSVLNSERMQGSISQSGTRHYWSILEQE
jgi:hypothetical protein